MKKSLLSVLVAGLFSMPAIAFEPFPVKDIRVEGIQRTEAGTVFSYLPVKVGDVLDESKASEAIRALFATGFFRDVRIEVDGSVMVVVLQERPAIAAIDFVGLKEFENDTILAALKHTGIATGLIFDRALLEKAEQELKRQYLTRGKYAATVTTTVTPLERNRVGINFNIVEGEAARIRRINLVGASAFKEKDLLDLFDLTTPGWMTWYTKNDQYSRQKLTADLEKLKSYYLDQGYLEFAVDSTQVSISPDKQDIYITINLTEGRRYRVSSLKLAGNFNVPEEELRKLVRIQPGEVFSRERLNESVKAISDRLGAEGYAFANVNAIPEMDKEKQLVAFTIFVDPGKRAYVRRVNISGNGRTKDEVVRREVRQMESAWYDADKVSKSKQRIDRLGFFTRVDVETPPVPGTSDQLDVNIAVEEKPTGNLMLGVGTSNTDALILTASIMQDNFMGSGNKVGIQVNSASTNEAYVFSFTNPYFTDDGISQGFDLYQRRLDTRTMSIARYASESVGGGIRFGVPISETQTIAFGLAVDNTTISTNSKSPQYYKDFIREFGRSNSSVPLTLGWMNDGKDSFFFPTKGTVQRANLEVALPGVDLTYYRASYQLQHYIPLTRRYTLMLNGEYGYADGYDGMELPFFKNYRAGGVNSVRGYAMSTLGTPATRQGSHRLGGNQRLIANAEVLWSPQGLGNTARFGVFLDAGQVYAKSDNVDVGALRYSTGVSASWLSPIGPLRFSIARPLNEQSGDKAESFQFQLGTVF